MIWSDLINLSCNVDVILAVLTCLFVWLYIAKRPRNFPPGPNGILVLGYNPFLGENAAETVRKMKSKYGSVISLQIGLEDWVILNDYDTIHEAYVKQGHKFSGRPSIFLIDLMTKRCGVAGVDYGNVWKSLRKFGLRTIKGLGRGKKENEYAVIEEAKLLAENLITSNQNNFEYKIVQAVCNISCFKTFGSRSEYDDENYNKMLGKMLKMFSGSHANKRLQIMAVAPFLRHIPPFREAIQDFTKEYQSFIDYFEEIIDDRDSTFDPDDIRDFVDAFLKEIKFRGEQDPSFNHRQLVQYIRDLIEPATALTTATLCWAILCFAHHPECQEKVYQEIKNVIRDADMHYEHYKEMPYTCAFLQELMRHRTIQPFGVLHKTTEDATLNGNTIPKNTTVAANVWAVHYDPELFEKPKEFRPERFIDENGKFIKSNYVIPFSVGPRRCMAPHLARTELFIFLTSIVKRVQIVPIAEKILPPFSGGLFNMLMYKASHFDVSFLKRED